MITITQVKNVFYPLNKRDYATVKQLSQNAIQQVGTHKYIYTYL